MLDADVVVDPDGIERLVRAGHDVSGAVVALRQIGWHRRRAHLDVRPEASADELRSIANEYAIRMLPGERPVDGFVRVHSIGSAAMLVSRSALVELSDTDLVERVETGLPGPDGDGSGWTFFVPPSTPMAPTCRRTTPSVTAGVPPAARCGPTCRPRPVTSGRSPSRETSVAA